MEKVFVGARFSRLLVLEKVASRRWKVRCDCGKEKEVTGSNLLRNTKSCGCLKHEGGWVKVTNRKPFGVSTRNAVLAEYKKECAVRRNLIWALSDEQFDEITKQDCYYCGAIPGNIRSSGYGSGDFIYNGIDRVDNSRGYEEDNVVPCCRICNRSKDVWSQEAFLAWAKRVVEHSEKRSEPSRTEEDSSRNP